jgi:NAD(P)-dependent dehydrogenase (short-subunit alcohol dehydrogenase family)
MGRLDGRRAVVVGGASGIGLATARRFVEEGATVGIVDRDEAALGAIEGHGFDQLVVADVRKSDQTGSAVLEALPEAGDDPRPILVNCAGTGMAKPLHTYSDKEWNRVVDVNLSGTFHALRAMIPRMLEAGGGVVVNVASLTGVRPTQGEAPYSAAKAGVIALSQSVALEYAPTIRANTVSPGMIDTPMTELVTSTPEFREAAEAGTPLGRVGRADEVAEVILFLASEDSSYLTGQNLVVDGGSILPSLQSDALLRAVSARFGDLG